MNETSTYSHRFVPFTSCCDEALRLFAGPFRTMLSFSSPSDGNAPSSTPTGSDMPVIGISGGGDGFAKLVLPTPNLDYELNVMTFDVSPGYPLLGLYVTGRDISIGIVLDPFTRDGRELIDQWHKTGHLALALFQKNIYLDDFVFAFDSTVAAVHGTPTPSVYSDSIEAPAVILQALHREMNLENLVLLAATKSTKQGKDRRESRRLGLARRAANSATAFVRRFVR
jgi:hypothetical protein